MLEPRLIAGSLLISFASGCTSAQIESYNYKLKHAMDWSQSPENQDTIKSWYFGVLGFNPIETGYLIDSSGKYLFGYMQCAINRSNARYYLVNPDKQNKAFNPNSIELCGELVDRAPAQSSPYNQELCGPGPNLCEPGK